MVIGAGGIGSYLLPVLQKQLTAADQIIIMDGDKLESRNLDRQNFTRKHVGRNKAEALASMYRGHGLADIIPIPEYLDDVAKIVEDYADINAIVACPDNNAARLRCMRVADGLGIVAILCGNEADSASAMVYDPVYKGTGADPVKMYPDMLESSAHDPTHACTGVAQEQTRQLASANNTAAAYGMNLLYCWVLAPLDLTGISAVEAQKMREMRPAEYTWTKWGIAKSPTIGELLERGGAVC